MSRGTKVLSRAADRYSMSTHDKRTRRALHRSLRNAAALVDETARRQASTPSDLGASTSYARALELARTAAARLRHFNRLHVKG